MNDEQRFQLINSARRFPPPQGVTLSYGTAGFRAHASILESTVFRMGILSALRSLKTRSVIGLVITASHNKVSDNGIKVADPCGGMLAQEWEPFANCLANARNVEDLLHIIEEFVVKENIEVAGNWIAEILLGRDSRPSGEPLIEAAKQGISSIIGAVAHDMGILTTPQLHWMVRARNKGLRCAEIDYFEQLSSSYKIVMDLIPDEINSSRANNQLIVDGAYGVGGDKVKFLKPMLQYMSLEVRNCAQDGGVLNENVGADFVQKEKVPPLGFGTKDIGVRCVSLDGDADRFIYFMIAPNDCKTIVLVDGDKILSLFATFIKEQLAILNVTEDEVRLGVVQTAYANGASTNYLKSVGLNVVFAPTGVKHLHKQASLYDIGIYFEANGHGTILFSDAFLEWLRTKKQALSSTSKGSMQHMVVLRLLAVSDLINQAVGDALSGMLLVEAILKHKGWSIDTWNELYHDLPSRQLKVKVPDRDAVQTSSVETVVIKPPGIQEAISLEISKYCHGRAFIRPSGTEDVIRVYAEASTQEDADTLASAIANLVNQYIGVLDC